MEKLNWATVILKLLGLLESIAPAFLVAWNAELRRSKEKLEAKVAAQKAEIEAKVAEEKIDAETANLKGDALLRHLIARRRARLDAEKLPKP